MARMAVVKFGGSSVSSLNIEGLVSRLEEYRIKTNIKKIVCVLSAEQKQTDYYLDQIKNLNPNPPAREKDALLSIGEHYSVTRAALAATDEGMKAVSVLGWQLPIETTTSNAGRSYIESIDVDTILSLFRLYDTLFVAGFQGVNHKGDITTLGRGGSDITAVALAAALKTNECTIISDTEGINRADPRIIGFNTQVIKEIHYDDALELSTLGAKIIQSRAVELASTYKVKIRFAYYQNFHEGISSTVISNIKSSEKISGIALSLEESLVSIAGIKNAPGSASAILSILFSQGIDIDMVTHTEYGNEESSKLVFTVNMLDISKQQLKEAIKLAVSGKKGIKQNIYSDIAKVSLVGRKIQSSPYVAGELLKILTTNNIQPQLIGGPRNRISIVVPQSMGNKCVLLLNNHYIDDDTKSNID